MPNQPKEAMKSIKIAASTHARLSVLADVLDTTISNVIDHALETAYPNVDATVEELQAKKRDLRKTLETRADQ